MAVFWPGVPNRGSIRQEQFGPATPGFLLLAGQPVPQRMNKIIVRQLVAFQARRNRRLGVAIRRLAFWIGQRDESEFAIEDTDQVIEVPRTGTVARGFQQLVGQPHETLDVRAGLGKQVFQNISGGLLMIPVLWRGRVTAEGILQKT